MTRFAELQRLLSPAWTACQPGSREPHVVVLLPSLSVESSLLTHHAARMPALEHRFLAIALSCARNDAREVLLFCSSDPGPDMLEYLVSLVPPERRAVLARGLRIVVVPDGSIRPLARKLLDRPDLLAEVRRLIGGRPAMIEAWNVREAEVEVALALGVPLNGSDPDLWAECLKSAGRRHLIAAGVPVPIGAEDVRSVADVVGAVRVIRKARPTVGAVVLKHDDSSAGDGNTVLDLEGVPHGRRGDVAVRELVRALPHWYRADLARGAVVEEMVSGAELSTPSVQLEISPLGEVVLASTHEQLCGGPGGQVYQGCRFPARSDYVAELATYGKAVGAHLAGLGAVGRVGVDFIAVGDGAGRWSLCALEINLRKGGTTHPLTTLRSLVPGRYDPAAGAWVADVDGTHRAYTATDTLVHESLIGMPPAVVIGAIRDAGLHFDHRSGTGVVLHMLTGLRVEGRTGYTAIGLTTAHADELAAAAEQAILRAAVRTATH